MIKRFFYGDFIGGRAAAGLLLLRVAAGAALMTHGWDKIQHPFSWMPPAAGIPPFLQFLAAFSEFFGGLAFVVGLLTPLAALGVICTMFVAAFVALGKAPFIASGAGASKEPALTYLFISLLFFFAGPGVYSLDHFLFGRKRADSTIAPESVSAR